jgi:hypothetical protein
MGMKLSAHFRIVSGVLGLMMFGSVSHAQAPLVRAPGRLELRVEDSASTRGIRLRLPGGDSVTFSPRTLLTGQDFARLTMEPDGDSSFAVVGTLKPESLERLKAENQNIVGKRVGVIVDGQLRIIWRIQSPMTTRMFPLISRARKATAEFISESLHEKKAKDAPAFLKPR